MSAHVRVLLVPCDSIAFDFDKFGIIIEHAVDVKTGESFHAIHVFYGKDGKGKDRMQLFMDHCESMYGECIELSVSMNPRCFLEIRRVFLECKHVNTDDLLEIIERNFPHAIKAYAK